ncbi:hypothetical protein LINPERPRIM_LOCUS18234 [Linum perenne]
MGDQTGNYSSSRNSLVATASNGNKIGKRNSIAALQNAGRKIARLSPSAKGGRDAVCHVGVFLLKLVALETVRRVSRSKCPPVWRGVQALQFLCYPPFKWIQRWAPFKGVVQGVQMMSRPLLVLSIATVFSDDLTCSNEPLDSNDGPHTNMETSPESPSNHSSPDASDVNAHSLAPEHWMLELHKELENQGITLPERINEDEIRRFYTTADGDFQSCLSSVKNTIRWRETYRLLSEHELGMWSNVVFWHGYDLENQPCLIVRLGLACTNLAAQDRPRFVQAVSNSSHLQQNFPNRLGRLVIIRLTPVARVIAQTFLQVLKPVTKEKLRVEGKKYHRVLSEYLQTVPAYLGGNCTCQRCSDTGNHNELLRPTNDTIKREHDISDGEGRQGPAASLLLTSQVDNCHPNDTEWDRVLKSAVIGILMACVFVVLVIGLYDSETRPFMAPPV